MAGFGVLARSTYLHETRQATDHLRDVGRSISFVIDSELDKRAAIALTLAAARSLRDAELQRFYEDAKRATAGTDNTVLVVDEVRQILNTRQPFGTPLPVRGWIPKPALLTGEPRVTNLLISKVNGNPVLTVMAP